MLIFWFFFLIFAFICGSIPFGYLIGRWVKHIDIRQSGSGNIGAANVLRQLGIFWGITTLILDILKGFVPVFLSIIILSQESKQVQSLLPLLTAFSAIAGHIWTPWLRFRGGKGIATAFGVFLPLMPQAILIALLIFAIVFLLTRIVSISSISASLAAFLYLLLIEKNVLLSGPTGFLFFLFLFTHRGNLFRLFRGEEKPIFPPQK